MGFLLKNFEKPIDFCAPMGYNKTIKSEEDKTMMINGKSIAFELKSKTGADRCRWYATYDQLNAGQFIRAYAKDGFEALLDRDNYEFCWYC